MSSCLLLGSSGFVGQSLSSNWPKGWVMCPVSSQSRENSPGLVWDVTTKCDFKPDYSLLIHAATPASAELNTFRPEEMFLMNVTAMTNVIEFASRHDNPPVVLFTSSGAVYGDMPPSLERIPEDWPIATHSQEVSSAYARGKIEAERMLQEATQAGKCVGLIARMFAFSGVHLPIDRHFAIGNFIRDAVHSRAITIRSDGSSIRSYMDGTDMASWLLRVIESGTSDEIYHIGSERSISIQDLASVVATRYEQLTNHEVSIEILGQSSPLDGVSRYVPSTAWTRERLGLAETVSLEESIDKMILNALAES